MQPEVALHANFSGPRAIDSHKPGVYIMDVATNTLRSAAQAKDVKYDQR